MMLQRKNHCPWFKQKNLISCVAVRAANSVDSSLLTAGEASLVASADFTNHSALESTGVYRVTVAEFWLR